MPGRSRDAACSGGISLRCAAAGGGAAERCAVGARAVPGRIPVEAFRRPALPVAAAACLPMARGSPPGSASTAHEQDRRLDARRRRATSGRRLMLDADRSRAAFAWAGDQRLIIETITHRRIMAPSRRDRASARRRHLTISDRTATTTPLGGVARLMFDDVIFIDPARPLRSALCVRNADQPSRTCQRVDLATGAVGRGPAARGAACGAGSPTSNGVVRVGVDYGDSGASASITGATPDAPLRRVDTRRDPRRRQRHRHASASPATPIAALIVTNAVTGRFGSTTMISRPTRAARRSSSIPRSMSTVSRRGPKRRRIDGVDLSRTIGRACTGSIRRWQTLQRADRPHLSRQDQPRSSTAAVTAIAS